MLPERPVSPNKKKILFLAVAMGVFIGCGATFLLEYFDRSFRSVDEVVDDFGIDESLMCGSKTSSPHVAKKQTEAKEESPAASLSMDNIYPKGKKSHWKILNGENINRYKWLIYILIVVCAGIAIFYVKATQVKKSCKKNSDTEKSE